MSCYVCCVCVCVMHGTLCVCVQPDFNFGDAPDNQAAPPCAYQGLSSTMPSLRSPDARPTPIPMPSIFPQPRPPSHGLTHKAACSAAPAALQPGAAPQVSQVTSAASQTPPRAAHRLAEPCAVQPQPEHTKPQSPLVIDLCDSDDEPGPQAPSLCKHNNIAAVLHEPGTHPQDCLSGSQLALVQAGPTQKPGPPAQTCSAGPPPGQPSMKPPSQPHPGWAKALPGLFGGSAPAGGRAGLVAGAAPPQPAAKSADVPAVSPPLQQPPASAGSCAQAAACTQPAAQLSALLQQLAGTAAAPGTAASASPRVELQQPQQQPAAQLTAQPTPSPQPNHPTTAPPQHALHDFLHRPHAPQWGPHRIRPFPYTPEHDHPYPPSQRCYEHAYVRHYGPHPPPFGPRPPPYPPHRPRGAPYPVGPGPRPPPHGPRLRPRDCGPHDGPYPHGYMRHGDGPLYNRAPLPHMVPRSPCPPSHPLPDWPVPTLRPPHPPMQQKVGQVQGDRPELSAPAPVGGNVAPGPFAGPFGATQSVSDNATLVTCGWCRGDKPFQALFYGE